MRVLFPTGTVVLLAVLLAGCVSAKKRFEQGSRLEARGRYAEAAAFYIKALRKDPDWDAARVRLQTAGELALAAEHETIARAADENRAVEGAEAYRRIDALRGEAGAVGVSLAVPDGYAARRRAAFQDAARALLAAGEAAEAAGRFPEAVDGYRRALDGYDPEPAAADALLRAQARALVRWGEAELDRGKYRAAVDRAEQALALSGPEAPWAEPAHALRAEAIDRGTLYVAFLPLWRTDPAEGEIPDGFLDDLNAELADVHWAQPPLFLAPIDPAEVRQVLRHLRYTRQLITRGQAAEVGQALGADLVLAGEIEHFARIETDVQEETRRDRWKAGGDTTYTVRRGLLRFAARIAYAVVDPATRRTVDEGTVEASAEARFERGVFSGRWEDLDLTRTERRWFDADERAAQERELEETLLGRLADRLASHVHERLMRRVG